jgi:hypothetical protein
MVLKNSKMLAISKKSDHSAVDAAFFFTIVALAFLVLNLEGFGRDCLMSSETGTFWHSAIAAAFFFAIKTICSRSFWCSSHLLIYQILLLLTSKLLQEEPL